MQTRNRVVRVVYRAVASSTIALLIGCSTPAPERPVQTRQASVLATASGFTVAENVRVDEDTRRQYVAALRLLEQKDYSQGIALLLDVTQRAPQVSAPYIDLGIAYGRTGDLDKGIASLERAVELNPSHPVAYNELGMLYRKKGDFAKARASYEKALQQSPQFHYARLNLAILCDLYLADAACALDNYTAYQQTVPDDKNAAMWIADLRARANK
jgi:Flp pilus assembly protein TadD